jgi:hypothetical protein
MLKLCNLPLGQGKDKTLKKLEEKTQKVDELTDNFLELERLYCNHILIGQKAVKLIQVEQQYIDKLIFLFKSHQIDSTIFHKTYPFILSEEDLTEIDFLPKLVDIQDTFETLSLIFCTRRSFIERTEIDINNFNQETQNKLIYYDKVIGTKKQIKQLFDVIVIQKEKEIIEVRIDVDNNFSSQERNNSFIKIINVFNKLIEEKLGIEKVLKDPINFFPLINKFYTSNNEGKVINLSFTTDEGSIKFEKMRKGKVDLRLETYHKAGKNAVHHITPYQITILWDSKILEEIKNQIELILPGKLYSLSTTNPSLEEVIIEKCIVLEEYNFILHKINTYLNHVS